MHIDITSIPGGPLYIIYNSQFENTPTKIELLNVKRAKVMSMFIEGLPLTFMANFPIGDQFKLKTNLSVMSGRIPLFAKTDNRIRFRRYFSHFGYVGGRMRGYHFTRAKLIQ